MVLSNLSPALGPMLTAGLLLGLAALAKLRQPVPAAVALARAGAPVRGHPLVRALAGAEVAIALTAIVGGGLWAAPLVLAYLAFAGFTALELRATASTPVAPDCGCFGERPAPVGRVHVAANVVLAVGALWAVADRAQGLWTGLDVDAGGWIVVAALSAVSVVGVRALLTDGAALHQLTRQGAS